MFKPGDWVWVRCRCEEPKIQRVHECEWRVAMPGCGPVEADDCWHVTVADAFEIAGYKMENGATLVRQCVDEQGLYWTAHTGEAILVFEEHFLRGDGWGGGWNKSFAVQLTYGALIDLSRLPVSDCWHALPHCVKDALENFSSKSVDKS
jgi:hypothetical protein